MIREDHHLTQHRVSVGAPGELGEEIARRLENNNILTNYQALPDDESFAGTSGIRLGVQEMTRFGMGADDFRQLAQLMADVILKGKDVKKEVRSFRQQFLEMKYCFGGDEFEDLVQQLHKLV